jgi:hypothetical protein
MRSKFWGPKNMNCENLEKPKVAEKPFKVLHESCFQKIFFVANLISPKLA